MINLTEEQARQIEEVLFECRPTVISHENWNDIYKARAIITAARAKGECATLDAHWVGEEELPAFNAWLNLFVESRIMEDRAARAHGRAETPFQLGQRLASEGQGISAIVYEIERDSDFDECLRGMRSVWNGDNFVVKRKQVEQGPVTCDVCGEVLQFKGHDCTTSQTVQYDQFDPRDYLDPDTGEPYKLVQPVQPVKQEPVAWVDEYNACKCPDNEDRCFSDKVFRMMQRYAAPVQPVKQEPVAWKADGQLFTDKNFVSIETPAPLYAEPVDAKAIRAEALEEAAKVCEVVGQDKNYHGIAAAIRGLK